MPLVALLRLAGRWLRRAVLPAAPLGLVLGLCQCKSPSNVSDADVVVSVKDQKLGYYRDGKLVQSYKVSTSKFGVGDRPGSWQTPLGKHEVIAKIGRGLPKGAVLKSRQWNGEVLPPNAPGRDPIVSRIIWLSGLDPDNHNALRRFIYIHGTTEENLLGRPASFGCVRMSTADVIDLFNEVNIGARVVITQEKLPAKELMLASLDKSASSPGSNSPVIELPSGPEPEHSLGQRHAPPSSPASTQGSQNVEPTMQGKQRLLIPVGHSLGKSSPSKTGPKTEADLTLKTPQKKGKAEDVASTAKDETTPTTPEKKGGGGFFGLFKPTLPDPKTAQQKDLGEVVISTSKDRTSPKVSQKKDKVEVATATKDEISPTTPKEKGKSGFFGLFKQTLPDPKTSPQKGTADVVTSTAKEQTTPKIPQKKAKGKIVASASSEDTAPKTPHKKAKGKVVTSASSDDTAPKTPQKKAKGKIVASNSSEDTAPKTPQKKAKGKVVTSASSDDTAPKTSQKKGRAELKKEALSLKNLKKEGGPESSPPSKKHKADTAA